MDRRSCSSMIETNMPLLSVVIPTHKRPHLVARAIASVIDTCKEFDVEILVVPNGPDNGWKAVAERHAHDPRIRWYHLPAGNACAARNHGLTNARGKYVRFLDDDDYLLPAAADQLRHAEQHDLDICSAPLQNISANGDPESVIALPGTLDFVTAAALSARVSLTQGSVFKRDVIKHHRWRVDADLYDDYLWMLELAAMREAKWAQTPAAACAYVQHDGKRLSRIRRSGRNSRTLVTALRQLHQQLLQQGRSSQERTAAVATALLTHAHSAFPASPLFLGSVIRQATAISPDAKPLHPIFGTHPWLAEHLLVVEWIMLPFRYLTRGYRRVLWLTGKLLERRHS